MLEEFPRSSLEGHAMDLSFQVVMWVNQSFLLREEMGTQSTSFQVCFASLRNAGQLWIKINPSGEVLFCLVVL